MLLINEEELLHKIELLNPRELTLQMPEGLRKKALDLAHLLEGKGYTVFISASPCYGACDLKEYGDLLIHVGHTPIHSPKMKVVYVDVLDDYDFIPVLKRNLSRIPRRVGLLTTAQHRLQIPPVTSFLRENGITPFTGKGIRTRFEGQILGCDLSSALEIQDQVEAFLYLGTGTFHPLGAAIATKKDVYQVYDVFEKVDPSQFLKKRHALIFKASQGHIFGIVISTKKGQSRKKEALEIREYLKGKGKVTYMFIADEIRPEILHGCDAYVICACPRIALDDAALYEKPVLTPREVGLMFEERREREEREYTMDMIE